MTEAELDKIMQMSSAAIIAPAGHGKTEMIADIVERSTGKQLLLTHTNAGVDAIDKRLKSGKYPQQNILLPPLLLFV